MGNQDTPVGDGADLRRGATAQQRTENMRTKNSSTPQVDTIETLTLYRLKAARSAFLALCMIGTGVFAADALDDARWGVIAVFAVPFALHGWWLWGDVQRRASELPAKPKREGPSRLRRFVWWLTSHKPAPKVRPEPFRRVNAGRDDEVLIPRNPGEMRAEQELLVPGLRYTASDVYYVVCRAYQSSLSERGWTFGDKGMELPSGDRLSRDGFREIQSWLVDHGYAASKPAYRLHEGVTPESVLEAL